MNDLFPQGKAPSLIGDSSALSPGLEMLGMDLKQKCKKCRRGVMEPTFNGNEFRCFVCGYTTEIRL